jgi:hypothetical protein
MEFKQAMLNEWPNEGLVARHQREIAPLLAKRYIFAGSSDFTLYDFWNGYGKVDENVFAYSNRYGDERSLVLYNNRYDGTRGTIHISAAFMDKATGSLRQRSLCDGLSLPTGESIVIACRDTNGLEYLRRATDLHWQGLTFDLRGFQCVVLLDWRAYEPNAEWPWDRLCDSLNGKGVRSVHEEMIRLRLRPLHDALRAAVSPANVRALAQLANELAQQNTEQGTVPNSSTRAKKEDKRAKAQLDPRLRAIAEKGQLFFDRLLEQIPEENRAPIVRADAAAPSGTQTGVEAQAADAIESSFAAGLHAMLCGAARLQALAHTYSTDWPAKSRPILPSNAPATRQERTWAPILAWIVLRSLPSHCIPNGDRAELVALFDRLLFRSMLADLFSSMGMEGEACWQAAAQVRLLFSQAAAAPDAVYSEALWADPDVRWLAGVNQAAGITFFNREQIDELLTWLQLPALIQIAHAESTQPKSAHYTGIAAIESSVAAARKAANHAGYNLKKFLAAPPPTHHPSHKRSAN